MVADEGGLSTHPAAKLYLSLMDGSDTSVFVRFNVGYTVQSVVIDQETELVYWSQRSSDGQQTIMMKNLYDVPSYLNNRLMQAKVTED